MFTALDHVSLGVRDLAEATRSTAALLGRRPSWRGDQPGDGAECALFRLGNTTLSLLAPAGEGEAARALRARLDAAGEGLLGLAFAAVDAESCRAELQRRGLAPGAVTPGLARDVDSGAFHRWRRVDLAREDTRGVSLAVIEKSAPDSELVPASAFGDAQAAVAGLDHVVVRTPDPDVAVALYGERLGLRLALDRRFPEWGVRLLFFRVADVTVELAAPLEKEAGDPAEADTLWGLSWRVPDADAARARLVAEGFQVSEVRPGRKPGTRVLTVRSGTSGVPTLFIEPARGSAGKGGPPPVM